MNPPGLGCIYIICTYHNEDLCFPNFMLAGLLPWHPLPALFATSSSPSGLPPSFPIPGGLDAALSLQL